MTPVVKDEQTGVDGSSSLYIHVVDVIDSLIERGVGIEVLAELHADALKIFLQAVTWKVGGAVEAHVFEEVCQTSLVLIFLNRTHFLGDVEESTFLGPLVVAKIIG